MSKGGNVFAKGGKPSIFDKPKPSIFDDPAIVFEMSLFGEADDSPFKYFKEVSIRSGKDLIVEHNGKTYYGDIENHYKVGQGKEEYKTSLRKKNLELKHVFDNETKLYGDVEWVFEGGFTKGLYNGKGTEYVKNKGSMDDYHIPYVKFEGEYAHGKKHGEGNL